MKDIIELFRNRRALTVFLLGFASGLPLALTGGTLQAWLTDQQFDIKSIGWFGLVALPYTWKFVWSPLLDRFGAPFLGRRRGWILITQLGLMAGILWMAFIDPRQSFYALAAASVMVAFFSASQDIVFDAYKVEVLKPEERGVGAGLSVMGYRIAMLVSGGGALILADKYAILPPVRLEGGTVPGNFQLAYLIMAGLMIIGIIGTLIGPEPEVQIKPPKTLREAVVDPFVEFFKRKGAIEMLLFVIIYKLDFVLANSLQTKFFMDMGFTKTEIGVVNKGLGLAATIFGTVGGGIYIAKLGLNRSLWVFGILQALTTVFYMGLTVTGHNYAMMVTAIGVENFAGGLATAAFVAFLMDLCDLRYSATQYALLTSAMAITRTIASVPAAYMVSALGWNWFYFICILLGIPSLYLLSRFAPWPGWRNSK